MMLLKEREFDELEEKSSATEKRITYHSKFSFMKILKRTDEK
jgi:hypothetical protein